MDAGEFERTARGARDQSLEELAGSELLGKLSKLKGGPGTTRAAAKRPVGVQDASK